jgi:hypothetical protein
VHIMMGGGQERHRVSKESAAIGNERLQTRAQSCLQKACRTCNYCMHQSREASCSYLTWLLVPCSAPTAPTTDSNAQMQHRPYKQP